jgi:hypothetical protein
MLEQIIRGWFQLWTLHEGLTTTGKSVIMQYPKLLISSLLGLNISSAPSFQTLQI